MNMISDSITVQMLNKKKTKDILTVYIQRVRKTGTYSDCKPIPSLLKIM